MQQLEPNIPIKDKISPDRHIKAEAFRKDIRKTEPHKHKQYFEIIYLTKGTGVHWIDGVRYELRPPVLYFITQNQVHNWELESEPDGYVVIIKKSFVLRSLDLELKMLLHQASNITCINITDNATIQCLFGLLVEESIMGAQFSFPVIEGLLKALLAKIQRISDSSDNSTLRKTNMYESFLEKLHQGSPVKSKVAYYAGLLNTSPQNLNAACRKAVDLPATAVLSDFIINEAKRLLLYTDKTVSEISFSLNFNDPSHFVKYFKRFAGQTPQSFRLNSSQMP
ncbi:helix-turn-helix domain-containing protein [Chitinophaga sancti]|uniref:helix-turn-helix domain-containing protein n=1 Tax=Chitinophaga sancti TaxID=1004 RepID=UPI003F7B11A4